jgi:hypothetical protein
MRLASQTTRSLADSSGGGWGAAGQSVRQIPAMAGSNQQAGRACGETDGRGGQARKGKDLPNCLHFSPFSRFPL